MERFIVQNFGCRASQADGSALESALQRAGMQAVASSDAELVVLNTCTVTATADAEVRETLRQVHRENPAARILVTGCYAQRAPEELSGLPGVAWVVGNSHKTQIPDLLAAAYSGTAYHSEVHVGDIFAQQDFLAAPVDDAAGDRTRPNLKIQDGCNNRCSFCIIPSVRGRSRSAPAQDVIAQVRALAADFKEVVLSGINLGRWGREPGSSLRLPDLLRRLLYETDIARIRISSVEPMDFSDDLLQLMAESPRIAPHVHAPLQSGSDTVLRRMHRKYRPRHYEGRVVLARSLMPDAAIGADVMAGFPGETEDEFAQTIDFIQRLPFTHLHVFTYSERPGTPAANLGPVAMEVRRERTRLLRELGERKNREFRQRMIGKTLSVVTLKKNAISENFLTVELNGETKRNELREVRIGGLSRVGLREANPLMIL